MAGAFPPYGNDATLARGARATQATTDATPLTDADRRRPTSTDHIIMVPITSDYGYSLLTPNNIVFVRNKLEGV